MPGMKRGKNVEVGWRELITVAPSKPPDGYSTTEDIAREVGISTPRVRERLRMLRKENRIKSVYVLVGGHWIWCYKG